MTDVSGLLRASVKLEVKVRIWFLAVAGFEWLDMKAWRLCRHALAFNAGYSDAEPPDSAGVQVNSVRLAGGMAAARLGMLYDGRAEISETEASRLMRAAREMIVYIAVMMLMCMLRTQKSLVQNKIFEETYNERMLNVERKIKIQELRREKSLFLYSFCL